MTNYNQPKVPINVPRKSGADKSHFNLLSAPVGTLVPIMCDELIPGTTVNLRQAISVSMPPLASDAYMKVDLRVEAFAVPMRILYGGFEAWFSDQKFPVVNNVPSVSDKKAYMPTIYLRDIVFYEDDEPGAFTTFGQSIFGCHTLLEYLGFEIPNFNFYTITGTATPYFGSSGFVYEIGALPLMAYHSIYNWYYRNPLIERNIFARPEGINANANKYWPAQLPYSFLGGTSYQKGCSSKLDAIFADGVSIFDLRQRNFGFDYFTNAYPSAQLGDAAKVTVDGSSQFTISQLRSMNSIQQFRERNNLCSEKMVDVVKARYGADLSSGVAQMPLFLGSAVYDVYTKSVDVTAASPATASAGSNRFGNVPGAQYGRGYAVGNDNLVDHFTANEPCYLMVIASLVPRATYGMGISRLLTRYRGEGSLADMANPLLQNVGNQPIYKRELIPWYSDDDSVFGYTDRYADFKHMNDEVHGLFRKYVAYDGESDRDNDSYGLLSYMALQRDYYDSEGSDFFAPEISSDWLAIPKNFMDEVTAVSQNISLFGYWLQVSFDYKVSHPLSEYSIPSLQDPAYEHGDTIYVHRGGFRL